MTKEELEKLVKDGKIRGFTIQNVQNKEEKEAEKKNNKYRNKKTEVDGITFDSKFESERYKTLKLLEKAGAITDLELQVPYELIPSYVYEGKKIRKTTYIADFRYYDVARNVVVVEDTKGYVTKEYALKKKLLLYKYPDIDFKEIHKK